MEDRQAVSAPVRRRRGGPRRRTGCFTCKSRRIRCDERQPICENCRRLGIRCRPSDFIAVSAWCQRDDEDLHQQRTNAGRAPAPTLTTPDSPALPTSTNITKDYSPSLGTTPSSCEQGAAQTQSRTEDIVSLASTRSPPQACIPLTEEAAHLLGIYRSGMAIWMDLTDPDCSYQRVIGKLALYSPLLLSCVCAFAAQQLRCLPGGDVWTTRAIEHYDTALELLQERVNDPNEHHAVTAAVLLSSYEILEGRSEEHQHHFFGMKLLIIDRGIGAQSVGLDRANFWIYVRHEIVLAMLNERPLQIPASKWLVGRIPASDDFGLTQELLVLVGKGIDLSFSKAVPNGAVEERSALLQDMSDWYSRLSVVFRGVRYGTKDNAGLTKVHFAVPVTAAAMLWYHTLCIMLRTKRLLPDVESFTMMQEHVQEILSISISPLEEQVRCFSVLPLYYAAKNTPTFMLKTKAIVLLEDIEKKLGYHTRGRIDILQQQLDAGPNNSRSNG